MGDDMQYVTIDANGTITAFANCPFPGSIPAGEEVVRTDDGGFVFRSEIDVTREQTIREQRERDAKRQQIIVALDALDAKGARAARAVALAVANGNPPSAVDVARLADIEAEAQKLRKELAAL